MKLTPEQAQAVLDALQSGDASAALAIVEEMLLTAIAAVPGEALSTDAAPEPDEDPEAMAAESAAAVDAADPEEDPEAMRALSALCDLVGAASPDEAIRKLSANRDADARKAAEAEAISRRALVADLIKLGAETPATAWADDERRTVCKRLSAESIDDMRGRVKALRAAKGTPADITPPRIDSAQLTPKQLSAIRARGMTPEEFLARKASAVRRAN